MTLKIGDTLDLLQIAVLNFAPEVATTAPSTPIVGQMWTDTSTLGANPDQNAITRYYDGHRWARMDGGGDIPDGMVENRHIADDAMIDWSKINSPALGTAADITAINDQLTALSGRVTSLEGRTTTAEADISALKLKDTALDGDISTLGGRVTANEGAISDLQDADAAHDAAIQDLVDDVTQHTTDIGTLQSDATALEGRVTTAEGEAVILSGRVDTAETTNTAQDARLDALETATEDINVATQDELDALDARVTTAEGEINTLQADLDTAESGLAAEIARATAAEGSIDAAYKAADTALGTRIDDEIAARTAGDATNASAISTETGRATAAEGALQTAIDDEVDRATTAEVALEDALAAEATRVDDALLLKADLVGGLVPRGQLPSIAIATVNVVADATERDALTADEGDIAVLADGGGTFIYDAEANAGAGGWIALASGADAATDAELTAAIVAARAEWEAADDALQGEIDAEETRASTAEGALQTAIDAEESRAIAAEDANATAISDEVTRATAAEGVLDGRITQEVSDRGAADTAIRDDLGADIDAVEDALADEVTRATAAEGVLTADLADEATTRQTADAGLQGEVDAVEAGLATEVTDRTNADSALDTAYKAADTALLANVNTRALDANTVHLDGNETITGTKTFAAGATPKITDAPSATTDAANKAYVDLKATGAVYDDSALVARVDGHDTDIAALQGAVTTETNARTSADSLLSGRLDTIEGDAATPGSIANAIAGEQAARSSADTALQNNINAEATNRTDADTALQGSINTEASARAAADTLIRTDFAAADTAVRGEFAAEDTAIRGEFAAADTLLQADIDARAMDTEVVHLDGDESIDGVKTFVSSPIVPAGAAAGDAVNKGQLDTAITAAIDAAAGDTGDLAARVDTLEGDENVVGSVANTADARIEAQKGVADGLATLDGGGKIPALQLPALALTNVQVVPDQAGLTGLTGMDEGDVAIVVDSDGDGTRQTYVYDGTDWVEMSSPADVTEEELALAVETALTEVTTRIDDLGAGAGLTRTGDTFDVVGTADRITVTADAVDLAATYAGQASITTVGVVGTGTWEADPVDIEHGGTGLVGGTTLAELKTYLGISSIVRPYAQDLTTMVPGTPLVVNHNLGTEDITYSIRIESTGEFILAGVVALNNNSVSVTVDDSYTAGTLRIVIHG